MPGHARSHRHLRGLVVADLAHHDDVRILPQDRAQAAREGQLGLRVDLRLPHAFQLIFDRILDRHDVALPVVQPGERGIERRRLAAARRPRHQHDAVRPLEQRVKHADVAVVHPQRLQVELRRAAIEQAQHHALAVLRRDGGDARIDIVAADAQRDAPVLRHALLRDIQFRHHLDPADEQRRQRALGLHPVLQHAVDPEPDQQALFLRLDVDVRRAFLHRFQQQRVDEADDGRIIAIVEQIVHRRCAVRQRGQIAVAGRCRIRRLRRTVAILRAQRGIERGIVERHHRQAHAEQPLHFQQRGQRRRAARHAFAARRRRAHDHAVPPCKRIRQSGDRRRIVHHRDQRIGHSPCTTVCTFTWAGVVPRSIRTSPSVTPPPVSRSASQRIAAS